MLCLLQGSVIIIILPLNAISAEQKVKIKDLLGTCLVYIYAKTISVALLRDIRIGKYTYILLSLELLASKKFYKVLTNLTFCSHVVLVIINEVYLVTNQGESFQKVYTQLCKAQILLGQKLQFTYIAMLDNITFKIIQQLAYF